MPASTPPGLVGLLGDGVGDGSVRGRCPDRTSNPGGTPDARLPRSLGKVRLVLGVEGNREPHCPDSSSGGQRADTQSSDHPEGVFSRCAHDILQSERTSSLSVATLTVTDAPTCFRPQE